MSLAIAYRDNSRAPLAFVLSVLLHGLLAGALVAFFFLHPTPEIVPSNVLELVAGPPSPDASNDSPASNPADASISVPSLTSLPPTKITESIPQPPAAPSEPSSTSQPKLAPKAVLTPGVGPRAAPSANTMSWQEWVKRTHPSASSSPRAPARPVPNVRVDPSGIEKNLQNLGSRAGTSSHTGQTMSGANGSSDDYDARLKQRVHDAFSPPQGYGGLSADISLTIAADGTIVHKELVNKSGSEIFDNAVRRTLELLTNVDPPPDGKEIVREFHLVPKTP